MGSATSASTPDGPTASRSTTSPAHIEAFETSLPTVQDEQGQHPVRLRRRAPRRRHQGRRSSSHQQLISDVRLRRSPARRPGGNRLTPLWRAATGLLPDRRHKGVGPAHPGRRPRRWGRSHSRRAGHEQGVDPRCTGSELRPPPSNDRAASAPVGNFAASCVRSRSSPSPTRRTARSSRPGLWPMNTPRIDSSRPCTRASGAGVGQVEVVTHLDAGSLRQRCESRRGVDGAPGRGTSRRPGDTRPV